MPAETDYPEDPKKLKAQQKQEDYEARKEHSNQGSNTHSGQGMEYVTKKNHSSRKDEEGQGREVPHGGNGGNSGRTISKGS
ncbi:hypothetical protein H2198_009386 [Neophaeococcomyces mojaviensis]|uniref:Uncharacterized protein n=1 Tax=Neophaeococcomyces mojaviensis TaxID=3383035 RepID=A0ACC2ZUK0_9EURO|nr:hypothetical protein H2198_009386 [Knufia sp. JES_112]